MLEILEFCFENIFHYLGITIWFFLFSGFVHKKVLPAGKKKYAEFKELYRNNLKKTEGK